MNRNTKRFWTILGAFSVTGLAVAACSSDNSTDTGGGASGGSGGKASAGSGGKAAAGSGGKASAGSGGNASGGTATNGGGGNTGGGAAGEAPSGGAAGEAPGGGGTGGSVIGKLCADDSKCTPGICVDSLCAAAECATTPDCTDGKTCTAGRCVACTTASVTFTYTPENAASPPTEVFLTGNFTGDQNKDWQPATAAQMMTKGTDGKFTVSISLAPGTYFYKFVRYFNGTHTAVPASWTHDITNPKVSSDGNGDVNSVALTSCQGFVAPECQADTDCSGGKVCTNLSCVAPCTSGSCSADMECGAHGRCIPSTCAHTFSYTGSVASVNVAGDFQTPNAWDPLAAAWGLAQLTPGNWEGTFAVPAGAHEYKLVLNGDNWILDPAAPNNGNNSTLTQVCGGAAGAGGSN
jgi:hypothetical protein